MIAIGVFVRNFAKHELTTAKARSVGDSFWIRSKCMVISCALDLLLKPSVTLKHQRTGRLQAKLIYGQVVLCRMIRELHKLPKPVGKGSRQATYNPAVPGSRFTLSLVVDLRGRLAHLHDWADYLTGILPVSPPSTHCSSLAVCCLLYRTICSSSLQIPHDSQYL